jgi:hypothetical protein
MAISMVFFHFATKGVAMSGMVYVPMPAYRTTRVNHITLWCSKSRTRGGEPDNRLAVDSYRPSLA